MGASPNAKPSDRWPVPVLIAGGAVLLLLPLMLCCITGIVLIYPGTPAEKTLAQADPKKSPAKQAPGSRDDIREDGKMAPKTQKPDPVIPKTDDNTPDQDLKPILTRGSKGSRDERPKSTGSEPRKTRGDAVIVPFVPEKDIKERVKKAGGQVGKVNVSLAWNNRNDLDLHVITASGERIFYGHTRSRCGGRLDVDQNVSPTTSTPVENVFWPAQSPPRGAIKIYVHHYRNHRLPDCADPTRFVVRVQVDGKVTFYNGSVSFPSNRTAFVAEVPFSVGAAK